MDRRDALRILATGAMLQLAPRKLLAVMREARSAVGVAPEPRSLNPHQFATVKAMAEMIIPRTDTPGATDVGTAEFIDLILTEWCDDGERGRFVNGIGDVDRRSQTLFAKDFIDCPPPQQGEILTALGEKLIEDVERKRDDAHFTDESPASPEKEFYPMLRQLTLTAYYTSEEGATKELHFQIIPDRHAGCVELGSGKEGQESQ
jgi:Gluconate 2-dehydrogenase subunit 3